jgi:16S rRNA processing protein RimM
VLIGKVLRPQGNCGELRVLPVTDSPDDLFRLKTDKVFVHDAGTSLLRCVTLQNLRIHQQFAIIKIAESSSIQEAKALAGQSMYIHARDRWDLPPDHYYSDQLIGLRVIDASTDKEIGVVSAILYGAAHDILVVKKETREILVPGVKEIICELSLDSGTIRTRLPKGLDEL